jgi:hypothetical protein
MVMKKAFGDDSPLRLGAGKSFRTLPTRVDGDGGYGTFRGWRLGPLGFSQRCEFIGGRVRSVDARGAHIMGWHGQGVGGVGGGPPPPPGVAGSLLLSVSPLDSVFVSSK